MQLVNTVRRSAKPANASAPARSDFGSALGQVAAVDRRHVYGHYGRWRDEYDDTDSAYAGNQTAKSW